MSVNELDVDDHHDLPYWVQQIRSGRIDSVDVLVDDRICAVLRPVTEPTTPTGWLLIDKHCPDAELPAPFDALGIDSNNIGAAIWLHPATGAMIAAVPTSTWNRPGQFAFHYAAHSAAKSIALSGWTKDQSAWDGTDSSGFEFKRDAALAYFRSAISARDRQ